MRCALGVLTRDVDTSVEGSGDLGIHLDQKLLLLGQLLIAVGYHFLDPRGKRLADEGVCDVDDPTSWYFVDIAVFGKVLVDFRTLASLL